MRQHVAAWERQPLIAVGDGSDHYFGIISKEPTVAEHRKMLVSGKLNLAIDATGGLWLSPRDDDSPASRAPQSSDSIK